MNSLFQISVLSFPMIFQNEFPQPYNGRIFQDFSNFRPKRNMFQDLRQANFRKKRTQMPNNFDAYLHDNEGKRSKYKSSYFIHYILCSQFIMHY